MMYRSLFVRSVVNFLLIFVLSCSSAWAKSIALMSNDLDGSLSVTAIKEVLARLGYEHHFPYQNEENVSANRLLTDIKNGDIDIMWMMTTPELESELETIYFPIMRGTLGMRVGLVKREQQDLFANVSSLTDLQRFNPGQGTYWADTFILEGNNIEVVKTVKYNNLFYMLEGERFDYFPRGIFEAWPEAERFADLNLAVDEHVLIKYKAPMYFYTSKENAALARQIFTELESMTASGEYQELFFANSMVQSGLNNANLTNRRVIELTNPSLSAKAPLHRKEFWFDPSEQAK